MSKSKLIHLRSFRNQNQMSQLLMENGTKKLIQGKVSGV
jgi:arginine repressor